MVTSEVILPPSNKNCDAVTFPLAFTLNLEEDIKKSLLVADELIKKLLVELFKASDVKSNEAIFPPVNKTVEPVICPLDFIIKLSLEEFN